MAKPKLNGHTSSVKYLRSNTNLEELFVIVLAAKRKKRYHNLLLGDGVIRSIGISVYIVSDFLIDFVCLPGC